MDRSPKTLVRLLLPRLPLLLKTALLNVLSLSANSSKQTLTTEIAVVLIRSIIGVRKPMRFMQRVSTKEPGIKGPILVAKVTVPAPSDQDGLRECIRGAIKELGDAMEAYTFPEVASVQAEWTSYHEGLPASEIRPDLSEAAHYQRMMEPVSSPVTILYFHGGAYFLMDPCTVREPVSRLARLTKGRCYSVRYRLAPQDPFPAQLLDALVAYLSLLSPPPGMPHEAVPAKNIVFAGDSAGGNLAAVLLQLLLTLRRMGTTSIKFHGVDVPIQLPAGAALNSPWMDVGRSMPSINRNAHFDYLDPPSPTGVSKTEPIPDDLWPTNPPRAEIFCNASTISHPLVSPLAAAPELWKGTPPVWMCLGNEGLEDEIAITARRMHQGGGIVQFAGYEGMPHCFSIVFPDSLMGRDCFARQARFCIDVVEGTGPESSKATWTKAFSHPLDAQAIEFEHLGKLSDQEVTEAMTRMQEHAIERENELLKRWNEQMSRAKL